MKALHVTKKDTRYRPISVFTEQFCKKEFYYLKMYQDTDILFLIITPKGNQCNFWQIRNRLEY